MKIVNSKIAYILSIILLTSMFVSFSAIPLSYAHDPPLEFDTHAYVTLSPNTVGVNQYSVIIMWLDWVPPTAGGLGGDRWKDFTLTVNKPDGTTQTLGPFTSGPVGTTFTTYTPDQVGQYSFVLNFPGQVATNGTGVPNHRGIAYVGDYFRPSVSEPGYLTVNQEPIETWQEPPLPTSFWTRPIHAANREWSQLASAWLKGSWLVDDFQRYGQAPDSPHILWTKSIDAGGIADGQWHGIPYNTNDYQTPWTVPIIMNGRIYYNSPQDTSTPRYGYYAVDLYTGEQIWYKNGTDNGLNNPVRKVGYASGANTAPELHQSFPTLSFGQIYNYYSVNGAGTVAYLWMTFGSTWYMLSAETGDLIITLKNVPGGTAVTDQDGSLLRYSYNANTGNLLCWNSSQSIPPSGPTGTGQQIWKPRVGAVIDARNDTSWTEFGPRSSAYSFYGIESKEWDELDILPRSGYTMNITVPKGLPGSIRVLQDANRVPKMIVGFSVTPPIATGGLSEPTQMFSAWALRIDEHVAPYSPLPDRTYTQNNNLGFGATLLWNKNFSNPASSDVSLSLGATSFEDGIFTIDSKETMQTWGFDLMTGEQVWGPTESQAAWDMYGMSDNVAYGTLYKCGYAGILYAYDIKTGDLKWTYTAENIGYESPYGNYPLDIGAIADGKVFLYSTEHSPTKPLWRGSYLRAIDANNGDELWKLLTFNQGMGVSDGFIVAGDAYDNTVEVIGKGPSKTTVNTQNTAAALGTPVLIQGMVTDESPGAPGTPAIADENMQAWMEYMYKQQEIPGDAKGVTVKLTAIGSNGATHDIGTVTSDMSGMFMKGWTAPAEGEYRVVASFEGSDSYWPSYGEAALLVGPGASASVSPFPTPSEEPGSSQIDMLVIAGVAVVVIVVAAVAALMLRRRSK